MRYRYSILLGFVLLEVLLFNAGSTVQAVVAVAEYAFVVFAFVHNARIGLMYFISFTLLSMAGWSYVMPDVSAANFWGLRVFGFSMNILFTALMAALYLLTRSQRVKLPRTVQVPVSKLTVRFLTAFVGYALVVGLVGVLVSTNYLDNFVADALVYLAFPLYIYLVAKLDTESILKIVTYGISLTVVSMVLSQLTGNMFQYAEGVEFRFVLMNSFAFVVVFGVFFMRSMYSTLHYYLLVSSILLLMALGNIFWGGKTIVCLGVALLWSLLQSRKALLWGCVAGIVLVGLLGPILSFVEMKMSGVSLTAYKLTQIYDIFDKVDLEALSALPTSMGNIVAEGRTIFSYLSENMLALLFGKGFGGGVPDLLGYLAPMAGPGMAYADHDVMRNDFVRMHLPIYEVALKAGVVGLLFYVVVLFQNFRIKNVFGLVSCVLLATIFTNSKETLLLTIVFLTLAAHYSGSRSHVPSDAIRRNGKPASAGSASSDPVKALAPPT